MKITLDKVVAGAEGSLGGRDPGLSGIPAFEGCGLAVLYCTVLYYTILYCTILYCTILYCTILCCTVLYCAILYYTVLYYTILYFKNVNVNTL